MRRATKIIATTCASLAVFVGIASIPVGGARVPEASAREESKRMDLSTYSDAAPGSALNLLFIHHSVGGHLLNSAAEDPLRGGGLRELLTKSSYTVHEATYGSSLGEHTDLFDWLPKFHDHMADVLAIDRQDVRLPAGVKNQIVLFKSCYPNSDFVAEGDGPGNAGGPELTLVNAQATLRALLPEFSQHPDVLFVYLTAPPLAPTPYAEPLWKAGLKKVLGKPTPGEKLARSAALARKFNEWVASPNGWLAGVSAKNVVVFDLFGILADGNGLLRYPSGDGRDSHPARTGSELASAALVPFLNRSVRRAGLVAP